MVSGVPIPSAPGMRGPVQRSLSMMLARGGKPCPAASKHVPESTQAGPSASTTG